MRSSIFAHLVFNNHLEISAYLKLLGFLAWHDNGQNCNTVDIRIQLIEEDNLIGLDDLKGLKALFQPKLFYDSN